MTSRTVSTALLALGVVAILGSWLWPYFATNDRVWSDARAEGLTEATLELHEQLHAHGHVHEEGFGHEHGEDDHSHLEHPDAIAASQRYRGARAELQSAQFWHASAPVYLRWGGLTVCLIALAAHFATRKSS